MRSVRLGYVYTVCNLASTVLHKSYIILALSYTVMPGMQNVTPGILSDMPDIKVVDLQYSVILVYTMYTSGIHSGKSCITGVRTVMHEARHRTHNAGHDIHMPVMYGHEAAVCVHL